MFAAFAHCAVDVIDTVNAADGVQDVIQIAWVAHLEGEPRKSHTISGGLHTGGENIDLRFGEDTSHIGKQRLPVQRLYLDLDQEDRGLGRGPLDFHESAWLVPELFHISTITAVDRDTLAAGDEAFDLIRRHWRATAGELHQNIAGTLDDHPGVGILIGSRAGRGDRSRIVFLGLLLLGLKERDEMLNHALRRDVFLTDTRVQSS